MNTETQTQVAEPAKKSPPSIKNLLGQPGIKARFEEILGQKAPGFISSILNVVNGNSKLASADPQSIVFAAAIAATLDLPINSNLGFAYIVPYDISYQEDGVWKKKVVAQFQMGWKGFVQLAERTGQYKTIGVTEIRAGQLKSYNPLTSEYDFDFSIDGGEVVGYASYFKLLNGFEKVVYWNVGKVTEHAKQYSQSYKYDLKNSKKTSQWSTNFDSQGKKTLVKNILSQWGILSIEMQTALRSDSAVVASEDGNKLEFPDNPITENATAEVVESITNESAVETEQNGSDAGQPAANGNKNMPKL